MAKCHDNVWMDWKRHSLCAIRVDLEVMGVQLARSLHEQISLGFEVLDDFLQAHSDKENDCDVEMMMVTTMMRMRMCHNCGGWWSCVGDVNGDGDGDMTGHVITVVGRVESITSRQRVAHLALQRLRGHVG